MADDDTPAPDGGGNANTPEQLRIAREDAKNARLDRDRYRKELDGLRGEYNRLKEASEADAEGLKKAHAEELDKLRIDLTGRATAAETKAIESEGRARDRIMMADLRIAAREAGMLDLDGLKLLDREGAKLDDDGNVTNAADLMTAMREAKPYLFGKAPAPGTTTGTTASTAQPPRQAAPNGFDARKADTKDYAAAKAEYLASAGR